MHRFRFSHEIIEVLYFIPSYQKGYRKIIVERKERAARQGLLKEKFKITRKSK